MRFLAVTNFTFMIISVCDLRHSRRAVDGPSWSGRSILLWFEVVRITAFTLVDMKETERGCTVGSFPWRMRRRTTDHTKGDVDLN